MFNGKKLILASGSPRRSALLSEHGYDFEVIKSGAPEVMSQGMDPVHLTSDNASVKANYVANYNKSRLVLGADTIVILDGRILGKPENSTDAIEMLGKLSGRAHNVMTAVALVCMENDINEIFTVISTVRFDDIPKSWIIDYVKGGEPMDKAGAYAIQGGAGKWIEGFDGSKTNIIGLPMEALKEKLYEIGYITG